MEKMGVKLNATLQFELESHLLISFYHSSGQWSNLDRICIYAITNLSLCHVLSLMSNVNYARDIILNS
jgi:hypothetical protein